MTIFQLPRRWSPTALLTFVFVVLMSTPPLAAFGKTNTPPPEPKLERATQVRVPADAIVRIHAFMPDGGVKQGSGFFVSDDGKLLTADHVIDGANAIVVGWGASSGRSPVLAEVVNRNASSDLALLAVEGSEFPHLLIANDDSPSVGDSAVALGYAAEHPDRPASPTQASGSISGLRIHGGLSKPAWLQTTCTTVHGFSGGPVVDPGSGEVIGLLRARGIDELEGTSYAASVPLIRATFPDRL